VFKKEGVLRHIDVSKQTNNARTPSVDKLNRWGLQYASQEQQEAAVAQIVDYAFQTVRPLIIQAMPAFLSAPLMATSFMRLELQLICLMRQLGLALLQAVVQSLESVDGWSALRDLEFDCGLYPLRRDVTANSSLST